MPTDQAGQSSFTCTCVAAWMQSLFIDVLVKRSILQWNVVLRNKGTVWTPRVMFSRVWPYELKHWLFPPTIYFSRFKQVVQIFLLRALAIESLRITGIAQTVSSCQSANKYCVFVLRGGSILWIRKNLIVTWIRGLGVQALTVVPYGLLSAGCMKRDFTVMLPYVKY